MSLTVPFKKKRKTRKVLDPTLAVANLRQLGVELAEPAVSEPISFPQSVEFTDAVAPVTSLVPTVSVNPVNRFRLPNIRVFMRSRLTAKKKELKQQLRACEKACKQLCNKKAAKKRKKSAKKKNAKKGKK